MDWLYRRALGAAVICVFASIGSASSPAANCSFGKWMTFKGSQLFRNAEKTAYTYATDHSRIDADGAPNAYHPKDVGKNCTHDKHLGLDCPANAGYPKTSWWPSVLVPDPKTPSKAYEQPDGPFKGYLVSKTWLSDSKLPDTDPKKYVDATKIPYVVFPGSKFAQLAGTGSKGDVGMAWNLKNGKSTAFIVADQGGGGDAKLGEGSIALYEALGGKDINPRTGAGVAPGVVRFIVFPGSRKAANPVWPQTVAEISARAADLLKQVGGVDAIKGCE
jgi:hypothetical protein